MFFITELSDNPIFPIGKIAATKHNTTIAIVLYFELSLRNENKAGVTMYKGINKATNQYVLWSVQKDIVLTRKIK